MYGSNTHKDCMYAAACHADNTFTGNNGTEYIFDEQQVICAYLQMSPIDGGLSTSQIIKEWHDHGLVSQSGAKIFEPLSIDPTDADKMEAAIYYFGGAFFMLNVPDAWLQNFHRGVVWDGPATPDPNKAHAVWWNGVDSGGNYKFQSWGTWGWITPAGVSACNGGCFVVFSRRWFNSGGVAPNGKTYAQLADLWVQSGGHQPPPW
jgi:hypothetical protein